MTDNQLYLIDHNFVIMVWKAMSQERAL